MKKSDSNFLIKKYLKKNKNLAWKKAEKKIRDGWKRFGTVTEGYNSVQGLKRSLKILMYNF